MAVKKKVVKKVANKKRAARPSTSIQKAKAKSLGLRVTKSVRGKSVALNSPTLQKSIASAVAKKKKSVAKAKKKKTTQYGTSNRAADARIKAKPAGERRAKKFSMIKYKKKNPKTGKLEVVTVKRRNATSRGGKTIYPTTGNRYTERRADRTDKGKFL
tara:strand:- start:30386 stop:30859 length:474 start_codon:yes stop_codon:yes gene_type:complete